MPSLFHQISVSNWRYRRRGVACVAATMWLLLQVPADATDPNSRQPDGAAPAAGAAGDLDIAALEAVSSGSSSRARRSSAPRSLAT